MKTRRVTKRKKTSKKTTKKKTKKTSSLKAGRRAKGTLRKAYGSTGPRVRRKTTRTKRRVTRTPLKGISGKRKNSATSAQPEPKKSKQSTQVADVPMALVRKFDKENVPFSVGAKPKPTKKKSLGRKFKKYSHAVEKAIADTAKGLAEFSEKTDAVAPYVNEFALANPENPFALAAAGAVDVLGAYGEGYRGIEKAYKKYTGKGKYQKAVQAAKEYTDATQSHTPVLETFEDIDPMPTD
jgi:hypothetical protein